MDTFAKEFSVLRELGETTFVLRGSTIIAEIFEEEVRTAGGLFVATKTDQLKNGMNNNRLEVARVLQVGQGYWNEEAQSYDPIEVQPGAVIILPQYSIQKLSTFPGIIRPVNEQLVMVKMDQIFAYYPTAEAYETAKAKLN